MDSASIHEDYHSLQPRVGKKWKKTCLFLILRIRRFFWLLNQRWLQILTNYNLSRPKRCVSRSERNKKQVTILQHSKFCTHNKMDLTPLALAERSNSVMLRWFARVGKLDGTCWMEWLKSIEPLSKFRSNSLGGLRKMSSLQMLRQ